MGRKVLHFIRLKNKLHKNNTWESDSDTERFERCVVCRCMTDISAATPISERKCYVPGAGQLCRKCCMELYGTDDLRSLHASELEQMFLGK